MPRNYTMERIYTMDIGVFAAVWAEGKGAVLRNMPWHILGKADATEQDKMLTFHQLFESILIRPDGVVWQSTLDGKPVALGGGLIANDRISWQLSVIGKDINGERSWFELPEANAARNAFWDSVGVSGWTFEVDNLEDNSIFTYFRDTPEPTTDKVQIGATEKSQVPGFEKLVKIDITKDPTS